MVWLFFWKCVSGISNVKTPAKNEKNSPVPAGYPSIKTMSIKKETGYYTVANVKGNNVDGYSTNSRITGVLPITQRSNMTAHIALMAKMNLLLLIVWTTSLYRQER